MQILIQGSSRRIKFTKGEVGKLKAAEQLLYAIVRQTEESAAASAREHLDVVLGRIDASGTYTESEAT